MAMDIIDKQLLVFGDWFDHFSGAGVLPVDLQIIGNVLDRNLELATQQRKMF
jgi:hypothetical protein